MVPFTEIILKKHSLTHDKTALSSGTKCPSRFFIFSLLSAALIVCAFLIIFDIAGCDGTEFNLNSCFAHNVSWHSQVCQQMPVFVHIQIWFFPELLKGILRVAGECFSWCKGCLSFVWMKFNWTNCLFQVCAFTKLSKLDGIKSKRKVWILNFKIQNSNILGSLFWTDHNFKFAYYSFRKYNSGYMLARVI